METGRVSEDERSYLWPIVDPPNALAYVVVAFLLSFGFRNWLAQLIIDDSLILKLASHVPLLVGWNRRHHVSLTRAVLANRSKEKSSVKSALGNSQLTCIPREAFSFVARDPRSRDPERALGHPARLDLLGRCHPFQYAVVVLHYFRPIVQVHDACVPSHLFHGHQLTRDGKNYIIVNQQSSIMDTFFTLIMRKIVFSARKLLTYSISFFDWKRWCQRRSIHTESA
jgi:hypothetical protein